MNNGVIYILTNPSFPDYVKIGFTDNVSKRLRQLNRSQCVPFPFRVYALCEVSSRMSELKLHTIIDRFNPNLRSIGNFNGHNHIREFYAMSPEDAYSMIERIAELYKCKENLRLLSPSEADAFAVDIIEGDVKKGRLPHFSFSLCQIPVGATIEYSCNGDEKSGLMVTVVDDRNVEYQGKRWSLSALAAVLNQKGKSLLPGPRYFKYNGEWLYDIRRRLGV